MFDRLRRAAPFALALAGCGAPEAEPPSPPPLERTAGPVVYGADDRVEWFEVADEDLRSASRSAAVAMIGWDLVTPGEGAVEVASYATLGESFGLCAGERFTDQPTSSMCGGTLIDVDLVLTAGHCVTNLEDCAGSAWVFDYLYEADGVLAPLDTDDVYRCVDLVVASGRDLAPGLDLAVIQLDRPVVGHEPAPVSRATAIEDDAPLVMTGFPSGLPLKVSTGAVHLPREDGDYFTASTDSFHGDSGSGVRNASGEVVGVLVDGAEDYASAGTCNVVSVLEPRDAQESVMFAHHAVTAVCERGFPSVALCGREATCGDGFCTGGESAESCKRDCDGLFAVPADWTCNAAWYGAGDDCDCACGAYDPDCSDPRLDVLNCAPGSECRRDGTCTEPLPEAWTCPGWWYADGDDCDCDCGALDPDCADERASVSGCAPGGVCQADGTCAVSYPEGWTCRRRFYDADDGCDCDCGAFDPDCADAGAQIFGCAPGSACLPDGSCELPVPEGWVCGAAYYGDGKTCDCRCGAVDPDCATVAAVNNCDSGETCDASGACTRDPGPVEPDPEPGPEPVEEVEPEPVEEVEPAPDVVETAADAADASDEDTAEPAPPAEPTPARVVSGGGCGGGGAGGAGLALFSAFAAFAFTRAPSRLRPRR